MPCLGFIGELVEISRVGVEELSVKWQIGDVLLLPGGSDEYYSSPEFRIGNEHWCLGLWPNWKRRTWNVASGWVRISLCRCDGGLPKTFLFSVGIKGSRGVEKSRQDEKEFWGYCEIFWNNFCSRSELVKHKNRLMPDSIFNVTCLLKRPGATRGVSSLPTTQVAPTNKSQPSDKQAMKELQNSLRSLLRSEEDYDVVIKVQGKEFQAHSLILRARSPVFEAMLEKQKGVMTMEDCDPETFPDFLEHIYTGSIGIISANNVFSLYTASDNYDLNALKKECIQFIKQHLTVASFCKVIELAIKHDEKELVEHATEFFCDNTLDIIKTAEWQIFLKENSTFGNDLFIKFITK